MTKTTQNAKTGKSAQDSKPKAQSSQTSGQPIQDPKSPGRLRIATLALLAITLLVAGSSLALSIINFVNRSAITVPSGLDGNSTNFTDGSIAEVAAKVAPSVVSILTETRTVGWFGQSSSQTSAGTGIIVSSNGYILTNKHVISGANSIKIILDDGTTYDKVSVVATDPLGDVAFLKIANATDLPAAKLGDSKSINVGQPVIAIGNALGQFQNTITYGIISGTGRALTAYSNDLSSAEDLTDMIQTDAAINAGNSGGPLVNAAGEVIGINTATTSSADGIGFAIPISSIKGMLESVLAGESAERAYLGVRYINLTPDLAATYELPVSTGAYLYTGSSETAILADGPATTAGLKDKDVITKINGISVGPAGSISTLIGEYAPGDTVQLTIIRDGKEQTLDLTLGKYQPKDKK